jgi:hypothetical protein
MFCGAENKAGKAAGSAAYLKDTQATENAAWRGFTPAEGGKRCPAGH